MFIGAFGISLGLLLFGPKLIKTVGQQITRINPMRAFSIALATAITVIIASALGLPVSSTHIAIGAIFGVGFFREYYITNSTRRKRFIKKHPNNKKSAAQFDIAKKEIQRRKLVRRSHFIVIITAWIVTVPASATLSAIIYFILNNFAYY
jgi:PiT family inorganic phosphate transporter